MIFGHDHLHPPDGKFKPAAPLWAKLSFAAGSMLIFLIVQPWRPW